MRWLALGLALLAASPAHAQLGHRLDSPTASPERTRPDRTRADRAGSTEASLGLGQRLDAPTGRWQPPAPERPREPPWVGPQIQLGYAYYRVSDGYGGGDVSAADLGVFVQLPIPELRVGLLGEVGARDYALGGDDLIARGAVEIGYQLLGLLEPFVPHAVAIASFGAVVAERFESTVAYGFGGGGIGVGGELRIYRNLHVGFQVSYQRLEMNGAAYDVFQLRLFAGL